ncbi:NADPH-dependent FMN reductase [Nocardia sp. NBC_01009]|uniref:NADPH-dependent FMN reductase n=1 Tax=Nocardia sp. NBC_01009 TaxID=2975996 RepID=UPI00386DED05|nr:NAD(P)H-dependent oxidoreductase [Nocardia sp. NBC_01009]
MSELGDRTVNAAAGTDEPGAGPAPVALTACPVRVTLILGSTRTGRFGPTVADWFAGRLRRRRDVELDTVDLATVGLPDRLTDHDEQVPPTVRELGQRLAAADAFVVVTPEYNRSFPAAVKNAIDWFDSEWAAKPVTVVSYGRDSDGSQAAAQLRQVFGELNAVPIRRTVPIAKVWQRFAADGSWPRRDAELDESVNGAVDQLLWWARALREARASAPFVL